MNEISEIGKREREFFDESWKNTGAREIREVLRVPQVDNLKGKKILICSCGSGVEPVMAANAGAEVFAFDISPIGVEKAKELAKFNRVSVTVDVMDFHHLEYDNDCFDLMYGSAILHHVDCNLAGREIHRCLKPGGIAFFREDSDKNPIIRWARRKAFGAHGHHQRQRFLFLRRSGTVDEYPLMEEEIATLSEIFDANVRVFHERFVFFALLARIGWRNRAFWNLLTLPDNFCAKVFPFLTKYGFFQEIWLQKPFRGSPPCPTPCLPLQHDSPNACGP